MLTTRIGLCSHVPHTQPQANEEEPTPNRRRQLRPTAME